MNSEYAELLKRLDHYADSIQQGVHISGTQMRLLLLELRATLAAAQEPAAAGEMGEEGPLSDESYVQKAGLCCPVCRSDDIRGYAVQAEARTAWQEVRCNACGSTWNDIYNLTGCFDVEVGNE